LIEDANAGGPLLHWHAGAALAAHALVAVLTCSGVEIIETLDAAGDQFLSTIGGISVATPMFSGL
jgi:hypothetical protein